MKKRGQTTIFIIISILIISIIILFFIFKTDVISNIITSNEISPNSFLQSCLEDEIEKGMGIISMQGGSIENPLNKTFKFSEEDETNDISYLCYTDENNEFCVNQQSMLIAHVEKEIHDYISEDVQDCLNNLEEDLRKSGYDVVKNYRDFEIDLMEKRISVKIDGEITSTKGEETSTKSGFEIFKNSNIYELLIVAQKIVNYESTSCNFNYGLFMKNYPEFSIEKVRTSDLEIVYRIAHKKSGENFRFAIRGCVITL